MLVRPGSEPADARFCVVFEGFAVCDAFDDFEAPGAFARFDVVCLLEPVVGLCSVALRFAVGFGLPDARAEVARFAFAGFAAGRFFEGLSATLIVPC